MRLRIKAKLLLILLVTLSFSINAIGQGGGFINKDEATNQLKNGLRDGKWIQYLKIQKGREVETKSSNATLYRLTVYKTGKPNGMMRQYFMNGKLQSEIPFENGIQNGMSKTYYENGKIFVETPFSEGEIRGVRRIFSELGDTILLDTVTENREYGVIKTYYSLGKLKIECPFVNDQSDKLAKINFSAYGVIHAYHNEKFTSASSISGEVDGVLKMYNMNGKIQVESTFSHGMLNGNDKEYYDDGNLKTKRVYKDDELVGPEKNYDETGFEIKRNELPEPKGGH